MRQGGKALTLLVKPFRSCWSHNVLLVMLVAFAMKNQVTDQPIGVAASLLDENDVQAVWNGDWLRVDGGNVLGQGNAVKVSRNDQFLYVTTIDGQLAKLSVLKEEEPLIFKLNITARCQSGVVETETGLLLYAVQDDDSDSDDVSRLLVVASDTMELQWQLPVQGKVHGTPVLSSNNNWVYWTHSTQTKAGSLSVLRLDTRDVTTIPLSNTSPVTPCTVVDSSVDNTVDIIYVAATTAAMTDDTTTANTETAGILWAVNYSRQDETYTVRVVSDIPSSANAAPAARVGGAVYLGQQNSVVLGWEDDTNPVPAWGYTFALGNGREVTGAIPTQPVLSQDGKYLFLVAVGNEVAAVQLSNGRVAWSQANENTVRSKPVPFATSDSSVVYYAVGSAVAQFTADRGSVNWQKEFCVANEAGCPDVVGDFSLNSVGNVLYYGDREGKLVGINVATFATSAPTVAPTKTPTLASDALTNVPSEMPTVLPESNETTIVIPAPSFAPADSAPAQSPLRQPIVNDNGIKSDQSSSPSLVMDQLPVILGAACGGLLMLIILVILYRRSIRRSRKTAETDTTDDDEEMARRSLQKKISMVLKEQEEGNFLITTPTKKNSRPRGFRSNSNNNTPTTFTSIADTPENVLDDGTIDGESVGFEVKSFASDSKNLDDAFSLASSRMQHEDICEHSSTVSVGSALSAPSATQSSKSTRKGSECHTDMDVVTSASSLVYQSDCGLKDDSEIALLEKVLSPSQTNAVSPLPSPIPGYLSREPGQITIGQKVSSPVAQPISPIGTQGSFDESLYLDDTTVGKLELKLEEPSLIEALDLNGLPVEAEECPEDEVTGQVRPGSHYLSRHRAKKEQETNLPIIAECTKTPADRAKPIYKGVSVRPSRSRAGLFSRRQPPISPKADVADDDTDDAPIKIPPILSPPRPTNSDPIITEETLATSRPLSPVILESQSNDDEDLSRSTSPHFTRAGFYVEESDRVNKTQSPVATDPWSSFLSELSKVEDSFFNPTKTQKSNSKAERIPRALSGGSDTESLEPPPPAPRTFYA